MDRALQRALASEVRGELARRDPPVTAKAAAEAIGISETAWQTYFKKMNRDVPMRVLVDLADFLGVPLWRMIQSAEERAASSWEDVADQALADLPPAARAEVERQAARVRPPKDTPRRRGQVG